MPPLFTANGLATQARLPFKLTANEDEKGVQICFYLLPPADAGVVRARYQGLQHSQFKLLAQQLEAGRSSENRSVDITIMEQRIVFFDDAFCAFLGRRPARKASLPAKDPPARVRNVFETPKIF